MNNDIEFFIKKFNVSRETIEKLNIYNDFLLENNKLLNLGAGFPGIIIKILMVNDKIEGNVVLIDKSPKKCKFLQDLSNKLSLILKIENLRLEDYKFNKISTVVSRAFKKTVDTIDILFKNNEKIRNIILIKGKTYQQELDDAKKKYTFHVEKFRSITSDESYILKISNIKLATT